VKPDAEEPDPSHALRKLSAAAVARLQGDWQVDAEADLETPEASVEAPVPVAMPVPVEVPAPIEARPVQSRPRLRLMPSVEESSESPPALERIVEAMLFVGGAPLTAAGACMAIRNFTPAQFQLAIDTLNRSYRAQRRPYQILHRDGGFALSLLPAYRPLRERLFGGPKETRLSQPALDVLAVIAYQQPVAKVDIDAAFGGDSTSLVRQLVRLGLVAVRQRADASTQEVQYGTTPKLLTLFGLRNLEELPRLGETEAL